MHSVEYDIAKLKQLKEIELDGELKKYDSPQAFFNNLTDFIENSGNILDSLNSLIVADGENEQERLFGEIQKIRQRLTALGMSSVTKDLDYLEKAAAKKDAIVLKSELSVFKARIEGIAAQILSAQAAAGIPPVKSNKIILAVDDSPAILASIVKMLEDSFTVMAVPSGKAALGVLAKHFPSLLLLDIEMPGMSGFELAKLIRSKAAFSSVPIMFLTSRNTRDDVILAVKHGGNDFIVKPVDKDLLLSKIIKLLQ